MNAKQASGSYQTFDSTLTAVAGLTTAAGQVVTSTGVDTFAMVGYTSAATATTIMSRDSNADVTVRYLNATRVQFTGTTAYLTNDGTGGMAVIGGYVFLTGAGVGLYVTNQVVFRGTITNDGGAVKFTGASVVMATAALTTSATSGFTYLPTCAGTPTGAPGAQAGTVASLYDTTNNKLWVYNGAWRSVTLA